MKVGTCLHNTVLQYAERSYVSRRVDFAILANNGGGVDALNFFSVWHHGFHQAIKHQLWMIDLEYYIAFAAHIGPFAQDY
ncbi:hypothetical protein AO260_27540 [Pseudomonas sp. ABAC21]|nr:hypothetical protein AO260_27540 [Pseudomonas sp. ABAC21]